MTTFESKGSATKVNLLSIAKVCKVDPLEVERVLAEFNKNLLLKKAGKINFRIGVLDVS